MLGVAVEFYTAAPGFKSTFSLRWVFATLSRGDLCLLLNSPGAGGAGRAMSNGQRPISGGWNFSQVEVDDLAGTVEKLRRTGYRFRNEIVSTVGKISSTIRSGTQSSFPSLQGMNDRL